MITRESIEALIKATEKNIEYWLDQSLKTDSVKDSINLYKSQGSLETLERILWEL